MPRIKKNKNCGWYFNTKFSDKIAIMYGGFFSILAVFACIFVTANSAASYLEMRRGELEAAADVVSAEVNVRGILTREELDELNLGRNIHVAVIDISSITIGEGIDMVTTALGTPVIIDRLTLNPRIDKGSEFLARYMTCIRPVSYEGYYYLVIVERAYSNEKSVLGTFFIALFIISTIGVLCSAFMGKYISKRMLKPIILITETAAGIGADDLSRRIDYIGPDDEIKVLADTFNDMISRLQEAFEKQTRFISDASHELRTPISVIQGYANLIDRWGKQEPEILQESIDSIKDETEQMSLLIKNLLMLAKYQQGVEIISNEPVSLNEAAREVIKEYNIMKKNVGIDLHEDGERYIKGNFDLIKQMIRIFIDNSIKYSDNSEEPIQIKVYAQENCPCISITDKGIGMAEKDIPYVFERFYRADESRNKEIPGTGIGLSIADAIMKNHGAKAVVQSKLGEGTAVTVKFPPEI